MALQNCTFMCQQGPMNVTLSGWKIISPNATPWYVQYLPDLILLAGITSIILTFYLSPELRNGFKTLIHKYRK